MIGIITALEKEYAAMCTMLDDVQEYTVPGVGAGCRYMRGTLPAASGSRHMIAVALSLDMGNNAAAIRTSRLLDHFPNVKYVLMIGIAGGVPNPTKAEDHVRLGDVVVSDLRGVVQYDLGKEQLDTTSGQVKFIVRTPPRPPSASLLEAARLLRAEELRDMQVWPKWLERARGLPNSIRPSADTDVLYDTHNQTKRIKHPRDPQRMSEQPRVFLGTIGSADRVLRNPILRDSLRNQFGVKAIEMESSGVADATWQLECGYLVVRGICDYCDTHKNDVWQEYAAAVAAAYTRGLLATLPADDRTVTTEHERPIKAIFDMHAQTVEKQINVAGDYYEIRGEASIARGNLRGTRIRSDSITLLEPDVQRAVADLLRRLSPSEQREVGELIKIVRDWRVNDTAALRELRSMVEIFRQALINLPTRDLPTMDQQLRDSITKIKEVVKASADIGTGLELSISLALTLLHYNINLKVDDGLDLWRWWQNLRERLFHG